MQDILLVVTMAATFAFGWFLIGKADRFLNEIWQNIHGYPEGRKIYCVSSGKIAIACAAWYNRKKRRGVNENPEPSPGSAVKKVLR